MSEQASTDKGRRQPWWMFFVILGLLVGTAVGVTALIALSGWMPGLAALVIVVILVLGYRWLSAHDSRPSNPGSD